jgi:drug/metabolite transporter (DMT)-like permease
MTGYPWVALGIACFMLRFFSWLALLTFIPLSQAILIVSLDIVAVMLGGRVLFSEALSRPRLVAVALISSGVALVGVR